MRNIPRTVVLALTGLTLIACDQSPTAPTKTLSTRASLGISGTVDPTLVTFNSASCTLTSSVTGIVNCSWNISNPSETVLNLAAEALLDVTYDCVNPKNGRVQSTETIQMPNFRLQSGVSSATLTGTNEALPWLILPTDFRGSLKKQNACKGNHVPQNAVWSLAYWDIAVITTTGTQRMSCFASDGRFGCLT